MKNLICGVLIFLIIFAINSPLAAQDKRLTVVATHSILADVVHNVAGDAADVSSLLPRNADPHSYTPTPGELVMLADADLVFVNGAFFEEGLLESIENAAEDITIVEASQCVDILPFGHDLLSQEDDSHTDGPCAAHHDEARIAHNDESLGLLIDLDCGEGHEHEEGEAGGCDPHVWTNSDNVLLWTLTIRDTLIEVDPAHAEVYAHNADAYIAQLSELASEIDAMVEGIPQQNRLLVTSHDSLGYFAARYDFEVVGVVIPGGSTLAEPSARDIITLIETIADHQAPAVFAEATINPQLAQQVADESGASIYTLYSGSLSEADGPASTYLDYMRYNVGTIVDGLD